jgi:hypothetical protein
MWKNSITIFNVIYKISHICFSSCDWSRDIKDRDISNVIYFLCDTNGGNVSNVIYFSSNNLSRGIYNGNVKSVNEDRST